eukprot:gene9576-8556_t
MPTIRYSKHTREFIKDGVAAGVRLDGRGVEDYRSFEVELDVFPQ